MVSSIYHDTRKSYYKILKEKLNAGNDMYTVYLKEGLDCYSGLPQHKLRNNQFKEWVIKQLEILDVQDGSIIPVDETIFIDFPQQRYESCTGDPTNWTHPEYWDKKQSDYIRIKQSIDYILQPLKLNYEDEVKNQEQNAIDEEIRLEKERKAKEIEDVNFQILLEKTKREGEEALEDERILRLLSSLGISNESNVQNISTNTVESKPSFSLNMNSALMVGGIGLVLLLGLKR